MDNDKSLSDEYKYKVIDTIGEQAWNGLLTYYKLRFKELDNEVSRKVLMDKYGQTFEEYCEDELMADLSSGMNVPKIEIGTSIYDSVYQKSKKEADILRQETRAPPAETQSVERFSLVGFVDWNKETRNNLNLQKVIMLNTEDELAQHIENVVNGTERKREYSLGAIGNSTLNKIERDINISVFKDRQYSFILSSDSILHVYEHFNDILDTVKEILKIHSMVSNYDSIKYTMQGNQKILVFEKEFDDASRRTVEVVSNRRNSLNLKTTYWTKKIRVNLICLPTHLMLAHSRARLLT